MLKRTALLLVLALLLSLPACQKKKASDEKTFPLVGTIVSRQIQSNALIIQHEKIEGFMEAMTMPFPVKGAKVEQLPPDGTAIRATLHVVESESDYWVSDVQKR